MSKKLALWISIFTTIVLILSTGVYFYQSKYAVVLEIEKRAGELLYADKRTVQDFLKYMKIITYGLYQNKTVTEVMKNELPKEGAEKLFLDYCRDIADIQAIRLVDNTGKIKVFMRECINLSGSENYEPIDISTKDFIERGARLQRPEIILSRFERGFLPDATKFCPSMLRTIIPFFKGDDKNGYLVVNFWGERVGGMVDRLSKEEGYSFISEMNDIDNERDGIFLFHKKTELEFANQLKHHHKLNTVYGEEVFQTIKNNEDGVIHLKNGDYLGFTTVYPYETKNINWKVCTELNGNYAFRNLKGLKAGFIGVLAVSITMALIISFIFASRFLRPIGIIKTALDKYGQGDFNYNFDVKHSDELSDIAQSIREMSVSLKKHIMERDEGRKKIEMLDRLSSLSVLTAGVSHELSTPLNSIMIACRILEKDIGENNDELDAIKAQAARCVEIINSMKRLMADGYESCSIEEVNLKELIYELTRFMKVDEGIKFKKELEDCNIKICRSLFAQAILNILINAVDAVYPKGEILINLFKKDGKAVLTIADNGTGIDQEHIERIFDPFYTTKSPDRGTGLGLSIAHKIITEHGGNISVKSEKNKGTIFRLELNECNNC